MAQIALSFLSSIPEIEKVNINPLKIKYDAHAIHTDQYSSSSTEHLKQPSMLINTTAAWFERHFVQI